MTKNNSGIKNQVMLYLASCFFVNFYNKSSKNKYYFKL